MAIEKNIEIDYGTSLGKYHRIAKVEVDYDNMTVDVYVRHYANENFRQEEKNDLKAIKEDISKIRQIEAKEECELTVKEKEDKHRLISSQAQQARRVISKALKNVSDTKYTFELDDVKDLIRDDLYIKIEKLYREQKTRMSDLS